ncbi:peptidoglycan-binding protein [Actinomadura sp. DC4]|uniref:peptidoglycan-binding protein n=1 Tax=Actinomadura sp. DC4 TaxID=3055069 RepID=UPI0025B152DA|nr:peptidoglycan-binding protein [Actinomadura sp. DC4]MDN3356460.1 peptidoglycan-binding protein [Actinomadura sp. DC4]
MSATSDFQETDTRPADEVGGKRGRRGYVVAAGVLAVAVGGGTTVFLVFQGGDSKASAQRNALPAATASIARGDVVDTESVDGKLTYSGERSLSTGASGVVTWAPEEGATIRRGKSLIKVGDKPVALMYGSLPLYRTLSEGVGDGRDVKQLEKNLKALGYGDGMTVDDEFTDVTAEAVEDWQDDMGLSETGSVDASQVVFEPGAVRVNEVKAEVGDRLGAGRPALTVTGTERVVHVDLDATKQRLAEKGAAATVEMPDGEQVQGRIEKVGTVAKASGSADQNNDKSTIDVDISIPAEGAGGLDQAPVTVDLRRDRSKNVLSVPVEALLALREGGFGVEVVEGGTSRIVAVRTGTFGAGRVEITGAGLREGMKVGVAGS